MKRPPVGVLLLACILDTRLLLHDSDVKARETCFLLSLGRLGQEGSGMEKDEDFRSPKKKKRCTRSERPEHAAAVF